MPRQVILGLFAGYSTSAVTLMRIVELIGSAEGKKIADQLMDELEETVSADDDKLEEKFAGHASIPASGIFGAFPLLDAIVLETNRCVHPCTRWHYAATCIRTLLKLTEALCLVFQFSVVGHPLPVVVS